MRIIELTIENFKNITAAEIEPHGDTIVISGENGAGKTAVLDAIWMALDQKGAIKENPDPIKHGETHAKVVVNLGKYVVTRTWTKTKSYLQIANAEGAVFKGPGAMLASLIGELSFDPQAFSTMTEKEQLNTLVHMIDMPVDIPTLDLKRKELYDTRTVITRTISSLKGQKDGIIIPEDTPDDETSSVEIMEEYQLASDKITQNDTIRKSITLHLERRGRIQEECSRISKEIVELQDTMEVLKTKLETTDNTIIEVNKEIAVLIDPDLEKFKCDLEDVEKVNGLVRKKKERQKIISALDVETENHRNISSAIENIDAEKATAMHDANMPIPRLSFNEQGVLYNDVPIKGCSAAEQLRVSIAMAMALNPDIRIIRITDGSLLDSKNMAVIEDMARDEDFQVWVEKVDESGKLGVFIQEGEIKHINKSQDRPEMPTLKTNNDQPEDINTSTEYSK